MADLFDLTGRTVIVTGASRGLGRGLALTIAAAGASVVAVARSVSDLDDTAAQDPVGRIIALPWDVADPSQADDLIARATELAGPVAAIVHAAGIQRRHPATEFSLESWRAVTGIHLDAPFFLSTALHRAQIAEGRAGAHVFIGSLTSSLGLKDISAYAASKSGLLGVVRTLAVEWAPSGARVNCLAPGYFKTELTADVFADPQRADWVLSRIPMGRLGVVADFAGAVIFLLSDASAYMTGQLLNVDGGWLAG